MKQITISKTKNGFTLTELIVVLAIAALLSSVAVAIFNNYTKRARLTEAILLIRSGLSNGAAKHKEAPLENTLSCESLGLKTRHIEKWNMECNYADEILSISAKSLKTDGTAGQNMSTGQWTINVSTGVVKPGIPTGI